MPYYLYLHKPAIVFQAQVSQSSFEWPIAEIEYNNVITGSYTDIKPGMTVWFGSAPGKYDHGIQRIRKAATANKIFFGWSSRGERPGEVNPRGALSYITVLNDFRVWAKVPRILDDGTHYKDYDIPVGDYHTDQPPVSNAGVGTAGFVDPTTGKLRVTLPHEANTSFDPNGTPVTYQWTLPAGVTLVSGSLTDSQITVDCDPGFYYIELTVSSNGKSHTARVPIFAAEETGEFAPIRNFAITKHNIRPEGQEISLRIFEDIPEETYPDGTLVMLWKDQPASPTDRSHMLFIGWHYEDRQQAEAMPTGIVRDVELTCIDVARKLDTLPGFPQIIERKDNPTNWQEMFNPNLDLYLHHLLHWHSTALEVADFTWTGTGDQFRFVVLGSDGQSLYDQVDQRARAFVTDRRFVCNRLGQLSIKADPMLLIIRDNTAQASLQPKDLSSYSFTKQPNPRVHWLRGEAIKADTAPQDIKTFFCIAPGDAPGQGEGEQDSGEQLARGQEDLNWQTGHRYARLNAPETEWTFKLAGDNDFGIDPALMQWVNISLPADIAAQRGLSFTEARFLPLELNITYNTERTGITREIELIAEREVVGTMATTVIMPEDEISDWDSLPFPDWNPIEFDPVPEGSSGGVKPMPVTLSPAMYVTTPGVIARNRTPGMPNPQWEVVLDSSAFNGETLVRLRLDSWDPKNRAYVVTKDGSNFAHVWEVTNLDAAAGTQSVNLLYTSTVAANNVDLISPIDIEGGLYFIYSPGTRVARRLGYGAGWSETVLSTTDNLAKAAAGHNGTGTLIIVCGFHVFNYRSVLISRDYGQTVSLRITHEAINNGMGGDVKIPYANNPNDDKFYYIVKGGELWYYDGSSNSYTGVSVPRRFDAPPTDIIHIATFNEQRMALLESRAEVGFRATSFLHTYDAWATFTRTSSDLRHSYKDGLWLAGWPWDENFFVVGGLLPPHMTYDAGQTWESLLGDWETAIGAWDSLNSIDIVWVP